MITTKSKYDENGKPTSVVGLRDYFENLLAAQREYFESRLNALDRLLEVKFAASKEATDVAFRTSETALKKSEQGQAEFNTRTNEFRQALATCQSLLLSRSEFAIQHAALEDKIEGLRADITQLREFRSGLGGKDAQIVDQRSQKHFGIETFLAILAVVIALVVLLLRFIH
jgi:hypothetical protein